METTKNRIKNMVEVYKRAFPNEYKTACEGIEMNRRIQKEGGKIEQGIISGRIVHEIPEKLYTIFITELNGAELEFYKSKDGSRWFAKTFPEFSLIQKI